MDGFVRSKSLASELLQPGSRLHRLPAEITLQASFAVFLLPIAGYAVTTSMFANLLHLITGRSTPDLEPNAFVREVHVQERERRNPRVERLILICWILIAIKHVAVIWAVARYPVPFHQLWINFPTWLLGALGTGIYYWSVRKR